MYFKGNIFQDDDGNMIPIENTQWVTNNDDNIYYGVNTQTKSIGINNSNPIATIDINGNIHATDASTISALLNITELIVDESVTIRNGDLTIGTIANPCNLNVSGGANFTGDVTMPSLSLATKCFIHGV